VRATRLGGEDFTGTSPKDCDLFLPRHKGAAFAARDLINCAEGNLAGQS
jgi:hypothetical protein